MLQIVDQQNVVVLPTPEALEHGLAAASMAIEAIADLIRDCTAARALILIDGCCEKLTEARALSEEIQAQAADKGVGTWQLENCLVQATNYRRAAESLVKTYRKACKAK